MGAKDILLQQKHTHLEQKDNQLQENATQISRQQRELQTLTVRNIEDDIIYVLIN